MKKIAITILLSTLVAQPAVADLYTSIKVGRVAYGYPGNSQQVGYGLLYGNTITKNFSVEGEFNNLGEYASATDNITGTAYSFSATGFHPIKPLFSLFGKVGLFRSALSAKAKPGSGQTGSQSISNRGLMVGFGAQFKISQEISVRAGVDIYPPWGGVPKTSAIRMVYLSSVLKF